MFLGTWTVRNSNLQVDNRTEGLISPAEIHTSESQPRSRDNRHFCGLTLVTFRIGILDGGATSSSNTSQAFEPGLVADDRRGTFDLQYFFLLEVSELEIQEHHRSTHCIPRPRNQIRSRGLQ
jgi:hypothetical protein